MTRDAHPVALGDLPASLPGIDIAAGLAIVAGNPKLYRRIALLFASSQPETAGHIQTALDSGDVETATRTAHSLKGAAANIGARELSERAAALEAGLRDRGDATGLDAVRAELERVVSGLAELEP